MNIAKTVNTLIALMLLVLPLSAKADIKIFLGAPAYKYHYKPYTYPAFKYHHYKRNRYSDYSRHRFNYRSKFNRHNRGYGHSYSPYRYKRHSYAPYINTDRHHRRHHSYEQGFYDGLRYGQQKHRTKNKILN